ncbi:hypothetical protein WOLCODRAFT_149717 [Wolfiporia cocos MD-104 SS10]|uniref:F-box domain-containing protein n=1 Tax=Wolfiporia cocos (strain MD-104) TaxID=742152 RepID=A0A2H3J9A2_WOLCO|nr:hypothetical protein WOLCODRAFT_149717 [Wolfiporia cocos MD-104 SS10]
MEIWDEIISYFWDEPETLGTTEEVCRGWFARSRYFKTKALKTGRVLAAKEQVYHCALSIRAVSRNRRVSRNVWIVGAGFSTNKGPRGSVAHFATFAATFAGLEHPGLSELRLMSGEWKTGTIPDSIFRHLSTYASITQLWLDDLTFPSITTFGRLICSLTGLQELSIGDVNITNGQPPSSRRRWNPPPNMRLLFLLEDYRATFSDSLDIFRALVVTKLTMKYEILELMAVPREAVELGFVWQLLRSSRPSLHKLVLDISSLLQIPKDAVLAIIGKSTVDAKSAEPHLNLQNKN